MSGSAASVRSNLLALAGGAAAARVAALATVPILARELGTAGYGDYVTVTSAGFLLAFVLHVGVTAVASREIAARPGEAAGWARTAVRARLALSLGAFAVAAGLSFAFAPDPWFYAVSAALCIPLAFDLKGLADAAGRTRAEVLCETAAGVAHLAAVVALFLADAVTPFAVALSYLGSRALYAVCAARVSFGSATTAAPPVRRLFAGGGSAVSFALAAERITLSSDVILLRLLAGAEAAGLFAAAEKVFQAAGIPLTMLQRILPQHFARSVASGDPKRLLETAMRAAGWAALPLAAGGFVLAEETVVLLSGGDFAPAAWTLRWLLVYLAIHSVGWRVGDMLFALRETTAFASAMLGAVAANWALTVTLVPRLGAAGSALGSALATAAVIPVFVILVRKRVRFAAFGSAIPPLVGAGVTAAAAWAAPESWHVLLRIACGAAACGAALWAFELRRGWRSLGTGLEAASSQNCGSEPPAMREAPVQSS